MGDCRTGNVLLSKKIFHNKENYFDPKFGKTGGEDVNFYKRMIEKVLGSYGARKLLFMKYSPRAFTKILFVETGFAARDGCFKKPNLSVIDILKSVVAVFSLYSSLAIFNFKCPSYFYEIFD